MPDHVRYILMIVVASWVLWYFSKLLLVAFRTETLLDSRPMDGRPVTRRNKPIAFWFSVAVAAAMIPAALYLIALFGRALLSLWSAGA